MLTKIARQFGTPFGFMTREIIRKRIEDLKQFDSTRYAQRRVRTSIFYA